MPARTRLWQLLHTVQAQALHVAVALDHLPRAQLLGLGPAAAQEANNGAADGGRERPPPAKSCLISQLGWTDTPAKEASL